MALAFTSSQAHALPVFTEQTGAPCAACHIGGFGPQLTPFGREFKLSGYTMGKTVMPFSAMAIGSFVHTDKDQDSKPAKHASTNDNLTLDEASLFVAGRLTSNIGGFIQGTYDGVGRKFGWDTVDLRAIHKGKFAGQDALFGLSLNNAPGSQDGWNTLPAWSFPYTGSDLAPGPAAAPLMADGMEHNVLGLSGYMWVGGHAYAEVGAYGGLSDGFLNSVGLTPDDSAHLKGLAPYARLAYQWKNLEVGAFGLEARRYPDGDRSTGAADRFTDFGVDGSYVLKQGAKNTLTLNGRYTHEDQSLNATYLLGEASRRSAVLQDLRGDLSYYWDGRVGASVGMFDTWGNHDALLYADNRTLKPDSNGVTLQVDFTPWPNGKTPLSKRGGARFGVQYTAYNKFDGAKKNYDGSGRNASDNNTLRLFAWTAF